MTYVLKNVDEGKRGTVYVIVHLRTHEEMEVDTMEYDKLRHGGEIG